MNRISSSYNSLWAPVLLCLVLQAVYLTQGFSPALDGGLIGPDSYMRLTRVLHLMAGGDWFSSAMPRSNAPHGETLHWTRLFDMLLIAGAWLARPPPQRESEAAALRGYSMTDRFSAEDLPFCPG